MSPVPPNSSLQRTVTHNLRTRGQRVRDLALAALSEQQWAAAELSR